MIYCSWIMLSLSHLCVGMNSFAAINELSIGHWLPSTLKFVLLVMHDESRAKLIAVNSRYTLEQRATYRERKRQRLKVVDTISPESNESNHWPAQTLNWINFDRPVVWACKWILTHSTNWWINMSANVKIYTHRGARFDSRRSIPRYSSSIALCDTKRLDDSSTHHKTCFSLLILLSYSTVSTRIVQSTNLHYEQPFHVQAKVVQSQTKNSCINRMENFTKWKQKLLAFFVSAWELQSKCWLFDQMPKVVNFVYSIDDFASRFSRILDKNSVIYARIRFLFF